MGRRNWTELEVRHALALYLVTDFGRFHAGNPQIIQLAHRLARSPSAVAMKLSNLAALDESIPQKGMGNFSKLDSQIWSEFLSEPSGILDAFEQQSLPLSRPANQTSSQIQPPAGMAEPTAPFDFTGASERRVETNQRIGQNFFRKMVFTSYRARCALTGIEDTRLLNASHIIPWKDDPKNRLNPSNGICLNTLHDRAFDRHLITFDEDYKLVIASQLPPVAKRELQRVETGRLDLPTRFLPDQEFLETHREAFIELERR